MPASTSALGRHRRGGFDDFVRGAELWMHSARMATVAIGIILVGGLLVWAGGVVVYLGARQTPNESYYLLKYGQARLFESVGMNRGVIVLEIDGKEKRQSPGEVVEALEPYRRKLERDLYNANLIAGLSALFVVFAAGLYWREFGRKKMQDETVRGTGVIGAEEANRRIVRAGSAGGFYLAGVPLPVGVEVKHLGMFGATGSGKTVAQLELLDQIRGRGHPAVVYDASGEFVRHFYRPGRDVILNPLDQRSPCWSPFAELRAGYDYAALAGSLYPSRADDPDKFWMQSAQRVFEEVLRSLAKKGRRSNAALYDALALSDLSDLSRLLAGTPAAKYTAPSVERTAIDIQMTVQNAVSSFRYLHDDGEPFSIRDWVAAPEDRWLFLTSHERQAEVLRPLISLWVSAAIDAVMDRAPTHELAMWLILDELPSLNYLRSLEPAMTRARKYGLACVLGVQQFSQLRKIYGIHDAQTILSMCQTKLILRVTDPDAAQYLARLIGQEEKDEKEETLSYGVNEQRDGVSVYARRQIRDLVLPAEIMKLDDLEGYLLFPGSLPAVKVKYGRQVRQTLVAGFVPRGDSDSGLRSGSSAPPSTNASARRSRSPSDSQIVARDPDAPSVLERHERVAPVHPRAHTNWRTVNRVEKLSHGRAEPIPARGRR